MDALLNDLAELGVGEMREQSMHSVFAIDSRIVQQTVCLVRFSLVVDSALSSSLHPGSARQHVLNSFWHLDALSLPAHIYSMEKWNSSTPRLCKSIRH